MNAACAERLAGILFVPVFLVSPLRILAAPLTVDLEVTQGIQYFEHPDPAKGTNTIDLAAQRPTVVRARIGGVAPGAAVEAVGGALSVDPAPGSPAAPAPVVSGPLNADAVRAFLNSGRAWDRADPDSTLNFKVDALEAGSWDFKVEVTLALAGGAAASGQGAASLQAFEIRPVHIRLVPLEFETAVGRVIGPPDPADLEEAIEFLQKALPLPDSAEFVWESPIKPLKKDRECLGQIDAIGRYDEVDRVLRALAKMAKTTVRSGTVPPDLFYYGFTAPPPGGCSILTNLLCDEYLGWSGGNVGFGTAHPVLAGKTFAHEFGHMLGLDHCRDCPDPGPDARPCDLDGQVGFDVFGPVGSTRPWTNHTSFMTCGGACDGSSPVGWWITPEDYRDCLEFLKVGSILVPRQSSERLPDPPAPRPLVVHGAVTPEGDGIEWLEPAFRYPWRISPTTESSSGPYEVEAADAGRTSVVVRRFDACRRGEGAGGSGFQQGFFSLVIPFPEDKEIETLTFRKDGALLRAVRRSEVRPEIGGITLGPGSPPAPPAIAIRWDVADADTEAADILHQVVFSPDGGGSFEPVAVDLEAPAAIFDRTAFPSSLPGKGLLRILVSDGLNTAFKDIDLPASHDLMAIAETE